MMKDESIGFKLRLIINKFERDYNNKVRQIGITSSQATILMYLFSTTKNEVNQRDIEKYLGLKNPTVNGILKRLELNGFIQNVVNADDRRFRNVILTEKAWSVRKELEEHKGYIQKMLIKGMSEREITEIKDALDKILENITEL